MPPPAPEPTITTSNNSLIDFSSWGIRSGTFGGALYWPEQQPYLRPADRWGALLPRVPSRSSGILRSPFPTPASRAFHCLRVLVLLSGNRADAAPRCVCDDARRMQEHH